MSKRASWARMLGSTENSLFSITSSSDGRYSKDASREVVSTFLLVSLESDVFIRNTDLRMLRRSLAKFVWSWSATPAMQTNRRWMRSSLDLETEG